MQAAHEHPDTADVAFDVLFARAAVTAIALTIGLPLMLAVLK